MFFGENIVLGFLYKKQPKQSFLSFMTNWFAEFFLFFCMNLQQHKAWKLGKRWNCSDRCLVLGFLRQKTPKVSPEWFFFWGGGRGRGKWDEVTAPERLESSLNNWFFLREKAYFEFLGESILSSHELKLFFLAICWVEYYNTFSSYKNLLWNNAFRKDLFCNQVFL